jgi:perosamine synthetase
MDGGQFVMTTLIPHSRPWIADEDLRAVEEVLQSGMIAHGHLVQTFEQAVATQLTVCGAIACTSGTAALGLALKVLNIGIGDEVILPTYVCWSVLAAITATGATPRFCDVNEQGVITVQTVCAQISPRSRAIVAVHIFGHPCDIGSMSNLGLPVIEDACQAFGLEVGSVPAGSLGTFGILSFHATKCMTTGEGGLLVSGDPALIKRARTLVESADQTNAAGFAAMSDLQAALGMAQLTRYSSFLKRRRETFDAYHQAACGLSDVNPGYWGEPAFLFRYTLRAQHGFEYAHSALLKHGVQARRGVDDLLHRRFGLDDRDFPCAFNIFTKSISLPFYPSLTRDERNQVIRAMQEVFSGS